MQTSAYYTESFGGSPGQLAKAEQVTSEFLNVQSGFGSVENDVLRAIGGQVGETLNSLPASASRANKWIKFDASGQPLVVSSPWNPRGAWAASTVYNVGDTYTYQPNNTVYYVTTGYTSGSSFGSTDTSNTLVLVNLASLFYTTPTIITGPATVNAVAGNTYGLDSSGGAITVNLPVGNLGDSPVNLTYLGGTLGTGQTQTVNAATSPQQYIMGSSSTGYTSVAQNQTNYSTSYQYFGSAYGWRLRTMG